jgi:hypothetical protein
MGVLTFTPGRSSHRNRRSFTHYDDLYALEFAERYGGSVLSGDRFEDILIDPEYR